MADTLYSPELLPIKGGTFLMGSDDYGNEEPIHEVQVDDFKIGKYQITVGEYLAFVEATNSNLPEWMDPKSEYNIKTGTDNHFKIMGASLTHEKCPIIGISWYNAIAFCNWLSQREGLLPVYSIKGEEVKINSTAKGYRLPTEAEWEYAARGGQQSKGYTYSGGNSLDEVGWYFENSSEVNGVKSEEDNTQTHPVGGKLPNELGIYDMSGNVWECCQDWYEEDYYKSSPKDNPTGPEKSDYVVLRGGSWDDVAYYCRATVRIRFQPSDRYNFNGFRVAQGS